MTLLLCRNLKDKTNQKRRADSDAESRVGVETFSYKISKQRGSYKTHHKEHGQ